MTTASERIYELAKEALREQQAAVEEIRGRGAPVAAAAAVIATLLSKPAFAGGHPSGVPEWTATVVALTGVGLIVVAFVSLYSRRALAFSVDTHELVQALDASDDVVDLLVAEALLVRQDLNQPAFDALHNTLATALGGLLLEVVGFGMGAALASQERCSGSRDATERRANRPIRLRRSAALRRRTRPCPSRSSSARRSTRGAGTRATGSPPVPCIAPRARTHRASRTAEEPRPTLIPP